MGEMHKPPRAKDCLIYDESNEITETILDDALFYASNKNTSRGSKALKEMRESCRVVHIAGYLYKM
jgi:hypothetical protein